MGNMSKLRKDRTQLSEIKKENPFGTPDNYFDDFSARLHTRLEAEKKVVPTKQGRIIRFIKPAIGLAASFVLVALLVYWPVKLYLSTEIADNNLQPDLYEEEFSSMVVESIDENSFFTLLDEQENGIEFSEEDLMSYVSTNISEYEIYTETYK
jgi:hypothetical protein